MPEELKRRAEEITAELHLLRDELHSVRNELSESNDLFEADKRANERRMGVFALVLVALLGLLGVMAYALLIGFQNADRLERDSEQIARAVHGNCSFYAFLLGTYRPESRAPGEAREEYVAAFARMREIYDEMRCTESIVPPATQVIPPGGPR